MGRLDGRVAIITGAAGGIGGGVAQRFAEEGARLVLADIVAERLDSVREGAERAGAEVVTVVGDIGEEAHLDEIVSTTIERFGQVDVLANIAQGGMADMTTLEDTSVELVDAAYRTGPLQSLLLMQKVFPYMRERKYGRIINTMSSAATAGLPGFAAYILAKGAVQALTRAASQEWAQYGIVTNTLSPGIRTPAFDLTPQGRAQITVLTEKNPTRRFGTPYEDCAPLVLFLASEEAGYINGQAIGADGGMYLLA